MEEEFDLEQIDRDMRMERIRQSSSKLTWDGFGQALKRNLMEKKIVFDADSRIDVIQAIRYLRKHVPVDANADLMDQLKQLSDSLECTFTHENNRVVIKNVELHMEILIEQKLIIQCMIGFFGRPLIDSPEGKELLSRNDYESLRDAIDSILNVIPTSNNSSDRLTYVSSLELVEGWLSQQNAQPVFDRINTSPYGYFIKRDSLRPSRIYYFVDAHYENATNRKSFEYKLDHNLPYLELSIVAHDAELEQPVGSLHDPWSMKRRLHVCYCLRFSVPILLSESTWYHLHKYLARHSVVRQHVNAFVYTSDFDFKNNELVLRTNFPSHIVQHRYSMGLDALKDEKDVVIGELYVENIKNLDKILTLLRAQQVHNTLWESVLCVTKGTWKGGDTVKMKLWAMPGRFELQFYSNECLHLVKIEQNKEIQKWGVTLSTSDGRSLSTDIDGELTSILNRTHSIPCVMVKAISAIGASASPDPAAVSIDDSDVVSAFMDKVGDSWLPRLKRVVPDIEPAVSVSEEGSPMGFLASFKEVEDILVPIPTRPEALPRTSTRLHSEPYANAFSDLDAICQMANSWDGDGKSTTPLQSAKFDSSPAPRPGGPLPPGGITQLSPLENARLRMAHSVSVASSGLPSTPDIFDFPDDRSGGSGSSYPSPSPHTNPFSVGSPNARGAGGKRRTRRKAANVGDRTASTDSNAPEPIKKPRMSNKPSMMASLRGRGRGSRKSSGLPIPEMERPMLQRSYSDYTATHSFPPTPTHVESPVPEEDSDDEACDPPPPPKNLDSLIEERAAAAAAAHPAPPPARHTTQTALASLLATTTAAATSGDLDKRIQPSRKTSLERLLGHKKSSASILPPPPLLKKPISLVSDIYDDGLDSPPLPGPSFPTLTPAVQGPSIPLPAQMAAVLNQTTIKVEPPALNSPKLEPPETKPEKIDPNSKLILKISKQRSSPSVDHQKNKIPIIPPTSMGEKVKTEKEKEKGERRKKESRPREDKKERLERTREDNRNKKRKGDIKEKIDRDHKRHKADAPLPPKIDSLSSLPFLQQSTLPQNFKIPKKEDKDTPKDPVTPTTPFTPTLTSPSFSSGGSSGHTLPPMNKPIIKKNPIPSPAHLRLNIPIVQPATYLPKKSQSDSNRRSSGGSSSSYLASLSSIPLPKGPEPRERSNFSDRSSFPSRWSRPSQQVSSYAQPPVHSHSSVHSQPPPRSPSPDAVQIDDTNSPEDSLRIAEE